MAEGSIGSEVPLPAPEGVKVEPTFPPREPIPQKQSQGSVLVPPGIPDLPWFPQPKNRKPK